MARTQRTPMGNRPPNWWAFSEPKWWRKLYKHRPRRRDADRMVGAVLRGADPDNLAWPLDKKPWVYYW